MSEAEFVATVPAAEVPEGAARTVEIGGIEVLVCHHRGGYFAIENRCSHAEEPLACGRMRNGWIACPAHGARFDLETGEALGPPADRPIRTFPLRVSDGIIEVAVAG